MPWGGDDRQRALFEILETRDLLHHVRAFVKWQAPQSPFLLREVRHVRPEDFASVDKAEQELDEHRHAKGESALTGVLYGLMPWANEPRLETLISATAFLMARGIFYREWSPTFLFQPPGQRLPLITGFSAWTRDRQPDYVTTMATAFAPDAVAETARRIQEDYARRMQGRPMPPLEPITPPPAPAPVPEEDVMDLDLPPAPVAPTSPLPPPSPRRSRNSPWAGLLLDKDLTQLSSFDTVRGPMEIHVAASGTLDGRRVYVEMLDGPLFTKYTKKLLESVADHVRRPMKIWKDVTLDEAASRWPVWRDSIEALRVDVQERRDELARIKTLQRPQTSSEDVKELQFFVRTIEPIEYVPFAGDLVLLVYDDEGWRAVDGASLVPPLLPREAEEDDAHYAPRVRASLATIPLRTLLQSVGEFVLKALSFKLGAVIDAYPRDLFVTNGTGYMLRGIGCTLPLPLYLSYVKRPLHEFYEREEFIRDQDEVGPPPLRLHEDALSHLITGDAWNAAYTEYQASPEAMLPGLRTAMSLPWPSVAEIDNDATLVFARAYTLAQPEPPFLERLKELQDAFEARFRIAMKEAGAEDDEIQLFFTHPPLESLTLLRRLALAWRLQRDGLPQTLIERRLPFGDEEFKANYERHLVMDEEGGLQNDLDEAKEVEADVAEIRARLDLLRQGGITDEFRSVCEELDEALAYQAARPSVALIERQIAELNAYVNDPQRKAAYEQALLRIEAGKDTQIVEMPEEASIPGTPVHLLEDAVFRMRAAGAHLLAYRLTVTRILPSRLRCRRLHGAYEHSHASGRPCRLAVPRPRGRRGVARRQMEYGGAHYQRSARLRCQCPAHGLVGRERRPAESRSPGICAPPLDRCHETRRSSPSDTRLQNRREPAQDPGRERPLDGRCCDRSALGDCGRSTDRARSPPRHATANVQRRLRPASARRL